MADKDQLLARLRSLSIRYQEENPFSMHPLTAREWEGTLDHAAEDAENAGASKDEVERAQDYNAG